MLYRWHRQKACSSIDAVFPKNAGCIIEAHRFTQTADIGHGAQLLSDALDRTSNYVRLVLYSDEITLGNALGPHNARRLEAIYWTFLDFDWPALSNELMWFTVTGCRLTTVARLRGADAALPGLLPALDAAARRVDRRFQFLGRRPAVRKSPGVEKHVEKGMSKSM